MIKKIAGPTAEMMSVICPVFFIRKCKQVWKILFAVFDTERGISRALKYQCQEYLFPIMSIVHWIAAGWNIKNVNSKKKKHLKT